jgi:alpha,alpha-trehalase
VYCMGSLLYYVQMTGLFEDGKTFVDMPMKYDPEIVSMHWKSWLEDEMNDPKNVSQLLLFVDDHFAEAGSDLMEWIPDDWKENPNFIASIDNENYRDFAYELNGLWKNLGRKVTQDVLDNPQRHSFLPRNYGMIVPGGRFRESYYWDSYWIVRGLLVCDMVDTALEVVNNFFDDISLVGKVPNGGRIYYSDRSQPPLLSDMVMVLLEYLKKEKKTKEYDQLLLRSWPTLRQEYNYWMDPTQGHTITVDEHTLNRYHSFETTPRPESYKEDVSAVAPNHLHLTNEKGYEPLYPHTEEDLAIYRSIRAGAESGWDFTSRFMYSMNKSSLSLPVANSDNYENLLKFGSQIYHMNSIHPQDILPVDLNTIMLRFEMNMVELAKLVGSTHERIFYQSKVHMRKEAIKQVFWCSKWQRWLDYNFQDGTSVVTCANKECSQIHSTVAQWMPLWAGVSLTPTVNDAVASLVDSGLITNVGVLTTTVASGQQWDAPNAWPPLVHVIIEGLQGEGVLDHEKEIAKQTAYRIKSDWLADNYLMYEKTGFMNEKYNAFTGEGGGGGEYEAQVGFGWTNGVALMLLTSDKY